MLVQGPQPKSGHAHDEYHYHKQRFVVDHIVRAAVAICAWIGISDEGGGRELALTSAKINEKEVRIAIAHWRH